MLKILDNFSDRLINILHMLFKSDGKLAIDKMIHELDISEKTLYDDFTFINENWEHIIEINISDSNEICAPKMSMSTFLELQSIILLDTVPVKILKTLFYHPNEKLNYYVEELHLSPSTLYKYIHILNQELVKYDIEIENNQSLYRIVGKNELSLRRFFTILFLEISGYSSKMFLRSESNLLLKQRIETLYQENNESISTIQISFYADLYYVSLQRESQGFFTPSSEHFTGKITLLTDEEKKRLYDSDLSITEEDLYRLESSLLSLRYSLNKYTDEHLEHTIPLFLDSIFETFKLDSNPVIYNKILTYLKDLYINDLFIDVPYHLISNKYAYFSNEANKNNAWAVSEISFLVTHLTNSTQSNFNYHIDYILYVLITNLPEIMKNRTSQHVLIISDNSKNHAEFICKTIQTELNMEPISFNHVDCIYKDAAYKMDLNSYEIIITNSFLIHQKVDSILINSFPSTSDIEKIRNSLLA